MARTPEWNEGTSYGPESVEKPVEENPGSQKEDFKEEIKNLQKKIQQIAEDRKELDERVQERKEKKGKPIDPIPYAIKIAMFLLLGSFLFGVTFGMVIGILVERSFF